MRAKLIADLARVGFSQYFNGQYSVEFYAEEVAIGKVWTLTGKIIATSFPVEENLGQADDDDRGDCQSSDERMQAVGNPVQPGIGNKFQIEADYNCAGAALLPLRRYYNSLSKAAAPGAPTGLRTTSRSCG